MGVEVRPFGVKCNIGCLYCYQNPVRDAGNILHSYSMAKMKAAIDREGRDFVLFGGEALMMPEKDLDELWSYGYKRFKKNGLQTNGTLINDNHIRMFKEYNVHVGISVDGPDDLNDVRWNRTLERTRAATKKTHAAIERLVKEDLNPSIIVTLSRSNATKDKLPRMCNWFRQWDKLGIKSARLHTLEVETQEVQQKLALSIDENLEALVCFEKLEEELRILKFCELRDMQRLLLGQDNNASCVWKACDPYTTVAVQGIEGNGQRSNCTRTNKDGVDFVKSDTRGYERYLALYHTPQKHGGCKGCRFFLMCKGQCPGTSIAGDWRNRTEHCEVWKRLYARMERQSLKRGESPLSLRSDRNLIEKRMVEGWARGHNFSVNQLLSRPDGTIEELVAMSHYDHVDAIKGRQTVVAKN